MPRRHTSRPRVATTPRMNNTELPVNQPVLTHDKQGKYQHIISIDFENRYVHPYSENYLPPTV